MNDWIGLGFLLLLIAGILIGLKILAKPQTRTEDEFERGVTEGATMLGASMNALHKLVSREATTPKEIQTEIKHDYAQKRGDGKANDAEKLEIENINK